jgi:hypothetical protein
MRPLAWIRHGKSPVAAQCPTGLGVSIKPLIQITAIYSNEIFREFHAAENYIDHMDEWPLAYVPRLGALFADLQFYFHIMLWEIGISKGARAGERIGILK